MRERERERERDSAHIGENLRSFGELPGATLPQFFPRLTFFGINVPWESRTGAQGSHTSVVRR